MRVIFLTITFIIFISTTRAGLVINEIQAAPEEDEPEWVELYNFSESSVEIEDLIIEDAKSSKQVGPISVLPYHYIIITSDSEAFLNKWEIPDSSGVIEAKLPVFNNTWDNVVIKDSDIVLDSVYYDFSWGKTGYSFERIDPSIPALSDDNLIPCIDLAKATPGKVNSVCFSIASDKCLTASPNPFSPLLGGPESNCRIEFNFPFDRINYSAVIFDTKGVEVRKLAMGVSARGKGILNWDGMNEEGYRLPVGPYVLFFEAVDNNSGKVATEKLLLVIGK